MSNVVYRDGYLTPISLFWKKVNKNGPIPRHVPEVGNCWTWLGGSSGKTSGYGAFAFKHKSGYVKTSHRASWIIHHGEIPHGMWVLHKCDNQMCVNPDHLFLGSTVDNTRDRCIKNRTAQGERHGSKTKPERVPHGELCGSAKLKESDVYAIRRAAKLAQESIPKLALRFGISKACFKQIKYRKTWKHLPEID